MPRLPAQKNRLKQVFIIFLSVLLAGLLSSIAINLYVVSFSVPFVHVLPEDIPAFDQKPAVLVLGAQVHGNSLSPVLKDRVEAGILCFRTGLADTLLLSGDHGKQWYDEVNAMRLYVQKNYPGLDRNRIFLDHGGFDTYDSIYRARDVFLAKNIIIVTQRFHVYRAVYIARKLGLNAAGFAVNQDKYSRELQFTWTLREHLARVKAFFETLIKRKPKFLGDQIPLSGSGRKTWDIGH